MNTQTAYRDETMAPLPAYQSILLAVDSSDHANRGILEAAAIAEPWGAKITGTHVYAARLHDVRFRQMEGGLPEQFRAEQELERQRDVHDDLITRGLSIITDSYLDQVERNCKATGVPFARRSLEGKNYHELINEANSGAYDLLVMGALGLGAVQGSRLGTVCQRAARRGAIDLLVIKEPARSITEGPIVVAVDGSPRAYGGLVTALALAREWGVEVKVIAAFDPYYHYVAFNRIAGVLSEEAGKVFRFQEQEKLHEEIIDSGLAKIYQGHLDIARAIAEDHGMAVETTLLDGKPHTAIEKYLQDVNPSLLVLGKLGVHADAELDIGGTAENLLHNVDCAVLLSQRQHQPRVEVVADATTSWTAEAEQRMERVPSFVRNMARMAILRYAQERGHTVITASIVEEATAQLMPGHAEEAMAEIVAAHDAGALHPRPDPLSEGEGALDPHPYPLPGGEGAFKGMRWSDEAKALLLTVQDLSARGNLSMRAEKKARTEGTSLVQRDHLKAFLDPSVSVLSPALHWNAAALARLMRVPEGFMREAARQRIEEYAGEQGGGEITLAMAEAGLARARQAMEQNMAQQGAAPAKKKGASKCPLADAMASGGARVRWSAEALERLETIPPGTSRLMTRRAAEAIAAREGRDAIDMEFLDAVLNTFAAGSAQSKETLPWDDAAREGIRRAPPMIRGMLIREIEAWARREGAERVDERAVRAVKLAWASGGTFHLDPDDARGQA